MNDINRVPSFILYHWLYGVYEYTVPVLSFFLCAFVRLFCAIARKRPVLICNIGSVSVCGLLLSLFRVHLLSYLLPVFIELVFFLFNSSPFISNSSSFFYLICEFIAKTVIFTKTKYYGIYLAFLVAQNAFWSI